MKQNNDKNLKMMPVKWKWEMGRRKTITSHIKSNIHLYAHAQKRHDRHMCMQTHAHAHTHTRTHTQSILLEQTKTHRSSGSSHFHILLNAHYSYVPKF